MPKNTPMRRKDRKVTDEDAIRFILMNQEVLHLGLSDSDRIYVVPVNYAFTYEDGHLALYFHGAKAGLKYVSCKKSRMSASASTVIRW